MLIMTEVDKLKTWSGNVCCDEGGNTFKLKPISGKMKRMNKPIERVSWIWGLCMPCL